MEIIWTYNLLESIAVIGLALFILIYGGIYLIKGAFLIWAWFLLRNK